MVEAQNGGRQETESGIPRPRRPITTPFAQLPDDALVDKRVVRDVTGLGDTERYERIRKGMHPAPILLGPRCARWKVGDLRDWLANPLNWRAGAASDHAHPKRG